MSDDFRKYFDEQPGEKHDHAVRREAERLLKADKPSFFSLPWLATGALAAAGLAFAIVTVSRRDSSPPPGLLAYEPAMLEEAELLLHLGALKQMDKADKDKKRREWPRKKS